MIRAGSITDIYNIIQLLKEFSQEADVGFRQFQHSDRERLVYMIQNWINNHYVRVIDVGDELVGIIVAELINDFWDPDRRFLQERAWYVKKDYRSTRESVRLWQRWQNDCDQYLNRKIVDGVLLSTQTDSTDFNPGRRGWRAIEMVWIKEA